MVKVNKKTQKGGVLLEAMAVLGLMTVATPLVYKKAIEKSKEIEDITVASQMRTVRDAAASYIEKNYETVQDGEVITLTQLNRYLPPNFINNLSKSLVPTGTAPDDAMTIVIKKDSHLVGQNALPVKRASAYVITNNPVGSGSVDEKRGNRIASLIGSEGGYVVDDKTIYGSNHAWEKDSTNIQPDKNNPTIALQEGQIVAATTFTKDPLSGDFLYRNQVEGFPQFNMMMINLDINGNSIEHVRSLGLKYNWQDDANSIEFNGETGEMIGVNANGATSKKTVRMKTDGKKINGSAGAGSLEVTAGSTKGCSRADADYDGSGSGGLTGCNSKGDETVSLTASYLDENNTRRESGKLSVRSAADVGSAEAMAYGGYATREHAEQGGAYELKDTTGATRTLMIGQEHESQTMVKKNEFGSIGALAENDASKIQLYDNAERLKTYVGAVNGGARFMVGDETSHLGNAAAQTVMGDAKTASITAKKDTYGYARMTARYSADGHTSGAALVANGADASKFDLDPATVVSVLAGNNNSGYLRLSNNDYNGKRVLLTAAKDGGTGGAAYLTGKDTGNYVTMEADHTGGAGYMEFHSAHGSSEVDSNYSSSSAYIGKKGDKDNVRLLSNGPAGGGHLTLDQGKVIFAANDASDFKNAGGQGPVMNLRTGTDSASNKAAIAAVGFNSQPTANVTDGGAYAVAHAGYNGDDSSVNGNKSSSSAVLASADGTKNTVAAYANAVGKYGEKGTVSVFVPSGNGGVNAHGHLLDGKRDTVYGVFAKDGGVVVAENTSKIGTSWLVGNSTNDGGMLSVGPDLATKQNRVDIYAAGGNGVDMGGTAHMMGNTSRAGANHGSYAYEGATIFADYQDYHTSASGMLGTAGGTSLSQEASFRNRNEYKDYALAEFAGNVTADTLSATDVDVKGDISFVSKDGKLYTNVLCVGAENTSKKNTAGLIDSYGDNAIDVDLKDKINGDGNSKCIALSPDAQWKDIVYKAVGDYTPSGARRGHSHKGFAKYGHEHPALIPIEEEHHEKSPRYVGIAKWHETGASYSSSKDAYLVGTVCTADGSGVGKAKGSSTDGKPGYRKHTLTYYTGFSSGGSTYTCDNGGSDTCSVKAECQVTTFTGSYKQCCSTTQTLSCSVKSLDGKSCKTWSSSWGDGCSCNESAASSGYYSEKSESSGTYYTGVSCDNKDEKTADDGLSKTRTYYCKGTEKKARSSGTCRCTPYNSTGWANNNYKEETKDSKSSSRSDWCCNKPTEVYDGRSSYWTTTNGAPEVSKYQ